VRVVFAGGGTGGHLYPGLAIARALVRTHPDVQPHFVGAHRGIEREILPHTEFPHTLLDAHPVYRSQPWRSWRAPVGFLTGWRRLNELAAEERPALVVGTGGYASAIPLAWARRNGIPIVQHIGDAFPGAAARLFARWSRECYLGFPEAQRHLPTGPVYFVTGNPIEPPPAPRPDRTQLLRQWRLPRDARVLLVFGGSQGSHAINEAVLEWTRRGLPDAWSVLWATGTTMYSDYQGEDRARVRVVPYLSPIADAYGVATLALVRGGMMGTTELCAWGIPMIIVPLPTAAADHQSWNARSLDAAGAAIHLPQKDLTFDRLDELVRDLSADETRLTNLADRALNRARPRAAEEIARHIAALLAA